MDRSIGRRSQIKIESIIKTNYHTNIDGWEELFFEFSKSFQINWITDKK